MKKEPLFIAFSTQKGGAGKTTLTVLMASYLYYVAVSYTHLTLPTTPYV